MPAAFVARNAPKKQVITSARTAVTGNLTAWKCRTKAWCANTAASMAPIINARIAVTGAVIGICAAMITEYGCVAGAMT